jgi:nitroreductase
MTLRQLIDAAIQAPSAVNEQPWSFSVVLDKALVARVRFVRYCCCLV